MSVFTAFSFDKNNQPYSEMRIYHNFQYIKLSRRFVDMVKNSLRNTHGCGLYAYCNLLSHAKTVDTTSGHRCATARLHTTTAALKRIFCESKTANIDKELGHLVDLGLIRYVRQDKTVVIDFLHYNSVPFEYNRSRFENICIKKRQGFVFVRKDVLSLFINNDNKVSLSERDMALSLWMRLVYNDDNFELSVCPIALFNDSQFTTIKALAGAWNVSAGKVHAFLSHAEKSRIIHTEVVHKVGCAIFIPCFSGLIYNVSSKIPGERDILITAVGYKAGEKLYAKKVTAKFKDILSSCKKLRSFVCRFCVKHFAVAPDSISVSLISLNTVGDLDSFFGFLPIAKKSLCARGSPPFFRGFGGIFSLNPNL